MANESTWTWLKQNGFVVWYRINIEKDKKINKVEKKKKEKNLSQIQNQMNCMENVCTVHFTRTRIVHSDGD